MDLDVLRGDATHKIYGIFFSMVGVLGSPNMPENHYLSMIPFIRRSGVKKYLMKSNEKCYPLNKLLSFKIEHVCGISQILKRYYG